MTFIEIGHWATVEIIPADAPDPKRLIVTDERLGTISLTMENARKLHTALISYAQAGLLGDE